MYIYIRIWMRLWRRKWRVRKREKMVIVYIYKLCCVHWQLDWVHTHTHCTVIYCRELFCLSHRVSPNVCVRTVRISSVVHVARVVNFPNRPNWTWKPKLVSFNSHNKISYTFSHTVQCAMQHAYKQREILFVNTERVPRTPLYRTATRNCNANKLFGTIAPENIWNLAHKIHDLLCSYVCHLDQQ